MKGPRILGYGVVSPAGWGRECLTGFLGGATGLAAAEWVRLDGGRHPAFKVPARVPRAVWQGHGRLRRASPVSHFTVGAALEALEMAGGPGDRTRLGVVSCVMGGSVQYSRRFYAEVLSDPATSSPLLFPETVFNAPASHLGAYLGATARNDTLVSDESGILGGLMVGAEWLESGWVDRCVVVCAEEGDWTTAEALALFARGQVLSEGAFAVVLGREGGLAEWTGMTAPEAYRSGVPRREVTEGVMRQVRAVAGERVFTHGCRAGDEGVCLEGRLGNGLAAGGGWAVGAALASVWGRAGERAGVCLAGSNLQVQGAVLEGIGAD